MLYCTRDAHKRDTTFEEGGDGDLVGCIEGDAGFTAGFGCFVGEAEAGEAGEIGHGEVELAEGGEVEGQVRCYALGVGEGVEDGETHIGDGDLGEDAAVDEFDEGVDGGLRVDRDADLCGREVEEAAGFDDLEALVHQGSGVDRNALAHDPCGVFEGLSGSDAVEVGEGGVAKGATGGGEPDLFDFGGGASAHALVDGVVLGVYGQEGYVVFARGRDDELACGDEALLVGQTDSFAGADGGVCGFEAGYSHYGGDDEVDFGKRGDVDAAGGTVEDFDVGDAFGIQAGFKDSGQLLRGQGDDLGTPAEALREGGVDVGAGGERDDLVAVREGLADGKGGVADGAGGAEDC